MILYVLLGGIVLFIIIAAFWNNDASKKGAEAANLLMGMEKRDEGFVHQNIRRYSNQTDDISMNRELLVKDVMKFILPDLQRIINLINDTAHSAVLVQVELAYFPNLIHLTEEYFIRSQKNKTKVLSMEEQGAYVAAAQEAVIIDINRRLHDLKI